MPIDYRETSAGLSQREAFARSRLARTYRGLLDRAVLDALGAAARLLDVGAGEGILLEKAHARRPERLAVALDRHPLNARICRQLGFPALRADASALPLASGCFDAVLLTNMLEHVDDPLRALREARRVLRPGGVAIVLIPHEENFRRARTLMGRREEAGLDYGHVNFWDAEGIRNLVREAGFGILRSRSMPLPWWFAALHQLVIGERTDGPPEEA